MNSHLKNILVAGTSAIPYAGSVISILLDKYIPDNIQKQRDKLIEDFSRELENIEEKIEDDFLKSRDFTLFFIRIFNKAMIENNEIKSRIFKKVLKNIALQEYRIDLETEMFMKLVEDLVTHQFYFLQSIKNKESTYKNIHYFTDKEHEKFSLTGLENYGLIEKIEYNLNYTKYGLTKFGEKFYSFVEFDNIVNEILNNDKND